MNSNVLFKTPNFIKTVTGIKEKFPHFSEKDEVYSIEEYNEILTEINNTDDNNIKSYAFSLSRSTVRKLICLLPLLENKQTAEKVLQIIYSRVKKSMFNLSWFLYQKYYFNDSVAKLMVFMKNYMNTKHEDELKKTIVKSMTDMSMDDTEKVIEVLMREGNKIEDFVEKYDILENSSFMSRIYTRFFKECDKDGYLKNVSLFLSALADKKSKDVLEMIIDYLKCVDEEDFVEEINAEILIRYGKPEAGNELWNDIGDTLKNKFNRWVYICEMRKHFGIDSTPYAFWIDYLKHFKDIIVQPRDNLICIGFGGFYIVDIRDSEQESFYYRKKTFEREYKHYLENKGEMEEPAQVFKVETINPKDVILKGSKADILRLEYRKVGILYIKELLKKELKIK